MNDPGERAELEAFRDFYALLADRKQGRFAGVGGAAAWFGFAGMAPDHRRKGSQGALFAARIERARELGVEVLATETGELVPDRPSSSYRNITRVGFEEHYVRPNYQLVRWPPPA